MYIPSLDRQKGYIHTIKYNVAVLIESICLLKIIYKSYIIQY